MGLISESCPRCEGPGYVRPNLTLCPECNGTGKPPVEPTVIIKQSELGFDWLLVNTRSFERNGRLEVLAFGFHRRYSAAAHDAAEAAREYRTELAVARRS